MRKCVRKCVSVYVCAGWFFVVVFVSPTTLPRVLPRVQSFFSVYSLSSLCTLFLPRVQSFFSVYSLSSLCTVFLLCAPSSFRMKNNNKKRKRPIHFHCSRRIVHAPLCKQMRTWVGVSVGMRGDGGTGGGAGGVAASTKLINIGSPSACRQQTDRTPGQWTCGEWDGLETAVPGAAAYWARLWKRYWGWD